jgi:hypothetical protein
MNDIFHREGRSIEGAMKAAKREKEIVKLRRMERLYFSARASGEFIISRRSSIHPSSRWRLTLTDKITAFPLADDIGNTANGIQWRVCCGVFIFP